MVSWLFIFSVGVSRLTITLLNSHVCESLLPAIFQLIGTYWSLLDTLNKFVSSTTSSLTNFFKTYPVIFVCLLLVNICLYFIVHFFRCHYNASILVYFMLSCGRKVFSKWWVNIPTFSLLVLAHLLLGCLRGGLWNILLLFHLWFLLQLFCIAAIFFLNVFCQHPYF